MRLAMAQGMHTRMPVEHLGEKEVQRCRKIWWTIYILDREMTSLMGLPQSINDDHIHTELPVFAEAQRTQSLHMHIKLSRIVAEINSSKPLDPVVCVCVCVCVDETAVYAIDGRLNRTFLLSTKTALASIAGLADELRHFFPLHLDRTASGVSRISACLHLLYHQVLFPVATLSRTDSLTLLSALCSPLDRCSSVF